jgi:TetR/AcrR family transcriptional regulator, transcriptional repressor for nem operon
MRPIGLICINRFGEFSEDSFFKDPAQLGGEGMTKGETTRQKIVAKAAPLFNQLGFAGCSMQDIMAATGLEKGGLYRHFASKEELAAEVFRYSLERVLGSRLDSMAEIDGAEEKLRFFIAHFVEIHSTIPGGCPVMNTAIDADDGNPALRKLVQEALQHWKTRIAGIVKAGIARGEIRADVAPSSIANIMIAALEGALMISRLEGNRGAMHDAEAMLDKVLVDLRSAPQRRKT